MSGFTSVLKNIGILAAQVGLNYVGLSELSNKLFPNAPAAPPGVVPSKLGDLYDSVKQAEFIANTLGTTTLTGDQKRALVVPAVTAAFLDIADFKGKNPEDQAAFQNSINQIVDGIVGAANSFKK